MTDVFTKEKRSWVMSRIRGKDTKPEMLVRSILHSLGYRFTVNAQNNKRLPGKPDIVLPKWKTLVFVHGCFWHAHEGCAAFRLPKTRTEWWREKLGKNQVRDKANVHDLRKQGWNVVVVWECELSNVAKIEALTARLPYLIERRSMEYHFAAEEDVEYGLA
ncbi:DNA mismatch endonuclease Vsr [Verrucomicrobiaceae bacterium N1E253]|uniref:Very short patch repair endonuclease n=1 Tax=Oceaniferula marina TaxID=2748318 RepID=A0A851GLF7_9BACT|nr:DNA mismatch endonuclease Vsr [Oceaniferula marina]NWK56005.1 DNA mismatch endonuclease Vsr [Oceaniferula marina]